MRTEGNGSEEGQDLFTRGLERGALNSVVSEALSLVVRFIPGNSFPVRRMTVAKVLRCEVVWHVAGTGCF